MAFKLEYVSTILTHPQWLHRVLEPFSAPIPCTAQHLRLLQYFNIRVGQRQVGFRE